MHVGTTAQVFWSIVKKHVTCVQVEMCVQTQGREVL